MLLSTYELLVKPIAPSGAGPEALARTVVQGYFLTIANASSVDAPIRLRFRARSPELTLEETVVITDIVGNNEITRLTPTNGPRRFRHDLVIPRNDTALVTLLPDVTNADVVANRSLETRGFVEILKQPNADGDEPLNLLVTPEHRGTFFSGPANSPSADIDQLAYALPTATGQALYTLT